MESKKKHPWYKSPWVAFAVVLVSLEFIAKSLSAKPSPAPPPGPARAPGGQNFLTYAITGPGNYEGVSIGLGDVLTVTVPGTVTSSRSTDDATIFAEPQIGGSTDFVPQKAGSVTATIVWTDGGGTSQTTYLPITAAAPSGGAA